MEETKEWNPYYICYAKTHGKTPEDMLLQDDVTFPGGVMCGYILWIREQWRQWKLENGISPNDPMSGEMRTKFGLWLEEKEIREREHDEIPYSTGNGDHWLRAKADRGLRG